MIITMIAALVGEYDPSCSREGAHGIATEVGDPHDEDNDRRDEDRVSLRGGRRIIVKEIEDHHEGDRGSS